MQRLDFFGSGRNCSGDTVSVRADSVSVLRSNGSIRSPNATFKGTTADWVRLGTMRTHGFNKATFLVFVDDVCMAHRHFAYPSHSPTRCTRRHRP
mmetsp:Transcript_1325/g.2704  ORF Transcript_1325/g.2704 Transcript_1325/m.2704 type:complete len:95 (+) Transcript_1325:605-889(+)